MDSKKLRSGYTTGTCAQGATKAAILMLLTGEKVHKVKICLPKGVEKTLKIQEISFEYSSEEPGEKALESVCCGVKKDSGDDPDITNGVLVYSRVSKSAAPGILIDGGLGIGRVTKAGLDQPVGAAAINRVPRMMIKKEVEEACEEFGYEAGIQVEISIPEGEKLAAKTFNPRLGIQGGLSILGTSGIVEPMSEQAIKDTIRVEMRVKLSESQNGYLIAAPGNYGLHFLEETYGIKENQVVTCSNYIGETLDMAVELGCKGFVYVGHIGKLVKVAGGIMNTHSKWADCRMELLAAAAVKAKLPIDRIQEILNAVTTDDALAKCTKEQRVAMMNYIMESVKSHLEYRVAGAFPVAALTFSNVYGILGMTKEAEELLL